MSKVLLLCQLLSPATVSGVVVWALFFAFVARVFRGGRS
jgi:hypothetical protein